jgi:hypothetical protein
MSLECRLGLSQFTKSSRRKFMNQLSLATESSVSYVNHLGQPVSTEPVKRKVKRKEKEARHDGWLAMGMPPDQVKTARLRHVSPESFAVWLRTAGRTRIRKQPFFSESSARLACDLAQAAGWEGVGVVEKKVD